MKWQQCIKSFNILGKGLVLNTIVSNIRNKFWVWSFVFLTKLCKCHKQWTVWFSHSQLEIILASSSPLHQKNTPNDFLVFQLQIQFQLLVRRADHRKHNALLCAKKQQKVTRKCLIAPELNWTDIIINILDNILYRVCRVKWVGLGKMSSVDRQKTA